MFYCLRIGLSKSPFLTQMSGNSPAKQASSTSCVCAAPWNRPHLSKTGALSYKAPVPRKLDRLIVNVPWDGMAAHVPWQFDSLIDSWWMGISTTTIVSSVVMVVIHIPYYRPIPSQTIPSGWNPHSLGWDALHGQLALITPAIVDVCYAWHWKDNCKPTQTSSNRSSISTSKTIIRWDCPTTFLLPFEIHCWICRETYLNAFMCRYACTAAELLKSRWITDFWVVISAISLLITRQQLFQPWSCAPR